MPCFEPRQVSRQAAASSTSSCPGQMAPLIHRPRAPQGRGINSFIWAAHSSRANIKQKFIKMKRWVYPQMTQEPSQHVSLLWDPEANGTCPRDAPAGAPPVTPGAPSCRHSSLCQTTGWQQCHHTPACSEMLHHGPDMVAGVFLIHGASFLAIPTRALTPLSRTSLTPSVPLSVDCLPSIKLEIFEPVISYD